MPDHTSSRMRNATPASDDPIVTGAMDAFGSEAGGRPRPDLPDVAPVETMPIEATTTAVPTAVGTPGAPVDPTFAPPSAARVLRDEVLAGNPIDPDAMRKVLADLTSDPTLVGAATAAAIPDPAGYATPLRPDPRFTDPRYAGTHAPPSAAPATRPAAPMPGTGMTPPMPPRTNRFAQYAQAAKRAVRRRGVTLAVGAGALVIGGFLVNQTITHHRDATRSAPTVATTPARAGRFEQFDLVRNLVMAPGQFARYGSAARIGGDYDRGALTAELEVLDQTFAATTDPEARLAILGAEAERGIHLGDARRLISVVERMDWIPDAHKDIRARQILAAVADRLAGLSVRDPQVSAIWRQRAHIAREAIPTGTQAVRGGGWSEQLAREIRNGIELAQVDPSPTVGRSPDFVRGYLDATDEAAKAYNLVNHAQRAARMR